LKDRPQKAEVDYFVGKVVWNEQEEERRLTKEEAQSIQFELIVGKVIDREYKITPEGRELIELNKMPLPENLEPYRESIGKLLKSIYTGEPFKPEDERKKIIVNTNANFRKKEFQALWE